MRRKRAYRKAVLKIYIALLTATRTVSWKGKACVSPEDYLNCAKEFAREYLENVNKPIEK